MLNGTDVGRMTWSKFDAFSFDWAVNHLQHDKINQLGRLLMLAPKNKLWHPYKLILLHQKVFGYIFQGYSRIYLTKYCRVVKDIEAVKVIQGRGPYEKTCVKICMLPAMWLRGYRGQIPSLLLAKMLIGMSIKSMRK